MSIDTQDYLVKANVSQKQTAEIIDHLVSHSFHVKFHRYMGIDQDLIDETNRRMIEQSGISLGNVEHSDFHCRASRGNVSAPFLGPTLQDSDNIFGIYYDLKGKSGEEIVGLGFGVARIWHKEFDYSRFRAYDKTPDFGYIWNTKWKSAGLSHNYKIGIYDVAKNLRHLSQKGYPSELRRICDTDVFYAEQITDELVKFLKELKRNRYLKK